ncbi:MAG: hypothetical protein QW057_07730 [Candidatus Bathyarchaeia archaeon]
MAPPAGKHKRIFFAHPGIVEKIKAQEVKCTYRRNAKSGLYEVYTGGRFHPKPTDLIIEVYCAEAVETVKLTDADAQLAGVPTARELLEYLGRWYGVVPETVIRNWYRPVQ